MSIEKDRSKLKLVKKQEVPEIDIKSHPEDIAEVDSEVLAKMRARLEGVNFDDFYDPKARKHDELAIKREKEKLLRVFPTPEDVQKVFKDNNLLKEVKKEIRYEGVDYDFLNEVSKAKYNGIEVVSEEFYLKFLFDGEAGYE